jgi:TetR/AcrR family transcriptional regulator, cholesterol catabolism regulator
MAGPKTREKIQEIQSVVAPLFAYKGYHSTSMREIARELGMNQSSLYHYFRGKEEILFELMNDAVDNALSTLKDICGRDLRPQDKLIHVLRFYTRYYAGAPERLILLVNEQQSLTPEHRRILVDKQRAYVHIFKDIFGELKGNRLAKEIPDSVAIFAFLGMVHYTITWYRKHGPVDLEGLADIFSEIFTRGVLA